MYKYYVPSFSIQTSRKFPNSTDFFNSWMLKKCNSLFVNKPLIPEMLHKVFL